MDNDPNSQMMMDYYNMLGELDDEDDLRVIYIPESEGSCDVEVPKIPFNKFKQSGKIKKFNIRTMEDPKLASINRDYLDDLKMGKVTDLLHEFQDLFLNYFFEMKGISGDLGEMTIPLKLDAQSIKK